ncbi:sensor histidine kinase [Fulvivirga sedimenti]|uniref:Histidine kinase n=1 Tax=Fulvivirga sedimenti TaxID=2879465 RepID=A0A9X1HLT0_9BACT|nr:sensor histidine kinase [Fulvivirga sedimenti]MCA6073676.1 histidine kinase [Fulvivirga sedimenti]
MKATAGCIITLIWVTLAVNTYSQSFNFMNFSIADGLVHDKVTDICEDSYGNLWIATLGGGLSKFNGVEFSNITIKDGLASNYVRSVLVDRTGRVWAATAEGISMYDGKSFRNYRIDQKDENNSVQTLFEDQEGHIWFAAFGGHFGRVDGVSLELQFYSYPRASFNDNIIAINQDASGRIWLVSSIQGLLSFHGEKFEEVISNQELGGYVLSIFNHNDTLWIGTNRGIYFYDIQQTEPEIRTVPALNNIFIKKIRVMNDRDIWMVTSSGIFNYREGELREFTSREGFTDAAVNTLFTDREGNIWFGTDGEGLYELASESFVRFGIEHGLTGHPVNAITRDLDGNYWLGTYGGGIVKYDGNDFILYEKDSGLSNTYISAAETDEKGNLWFGTLSAGLIIYDGVSFRDIGENEGLELLGIRFLFHDSENNMWIGSGEGLARWDGSSFTNYTTDDGLYDNIIWTISEPEPGRILIVTREGFNFFENGRIQQGFNDPSIFSNRVNTAFEDALGNYWIGYSGHGIIRVDHETGNVSGYSDENGLNSNLIYNLIYDEQANDIVVGTERGIDRIDLDENLEVERIKTFQRIEGFNNLQTLPHAVYRDSDGSIWFGTRRELFRYQPDKIRVNKNEPIVYISGVQLIYDDVDWTEYTDSVGSWHNVPADLNLSHTNNNLAISFFGNSLRNPNEVQYKFRMVGLKNEWSAVTTNNQASYTNLSPGDYQFEVMAANSDGVWTKEPAVFAFSIVPPFWQRPWFFGIVILYFIVMISLYNNYRVRANLNKILTIEKIRQEELTKVRKRMARDFHDNMGNQIASITMYANLISLKLQNRTDEIDHLLHNIEKHTKTLFTGTKDFIWSMDPDSDHLGKVYTYIKDFGEELFDNTPIIFYADIKGTVSDDIPLPSGWSRQIVLIFKETMTNTLKHSQASEVHLDMEPKSGGFVINCRDNGKGIAADQTGKGYGLKNMKVRAGQIGCELEFLTPSEGTGTIVQFRARLPREKRNGVVKKFFNKTTTR